MKAREVHTSRESKRNFDHMAPDYEQLEEHERKVQQLAERQEEKEHELQVDPVYNVMGSTAGAGSGDFHMYRGYRNKEMARVADMERERKLEEGNAQWEEERKERMAEEEAKTNKRAQKRARKKEKQKASKAANAGGGGPSGSAAGTGSSAGGAGAGEPGPASP